jgi:hypothetical protein
MISENASDLDYRGELSLAPLANLKIIILSLLKDWGIKGDDKYGE